MDNDERCCLCGQSGHRADTCPLGGQIPGELKVSNVDKVLEAIRSGADYIRVAAEATGLPVKAVCSAFDQLRAIRYIEAYAHAPRVPGVGSPQLRYRTTETLARVEHARAAVARASEMPAIDANTHALHQRMGMFAGLVR